jgi:hypothetical protein
MMNETPITTARRLSRRAEQNRCLQCGRKTKIEQHHVAGQNHDADFTAPLCPACHAQVTENLRRADVDMRRTPNADERVRRALKATAVFLWMLAEALWRWAESLKPLPQTHYRSNSCAKSFGDSPRIKEQKQ